MSVIRNKEKNIDVEQLRELSRQVVLDAVEEKQRKVDFIYNTILEKISKNNYAIDRDGYIHVYVFMSPQDYKIADAVSDKLRENGFSDASHRYEFPLGVTWKIKA